MSRALWPLLMRPSWLDGLALLAIVTALPAAAQQPATPPTVYTGTFITLDPAQPRARAIAVREGRIIAVGSQSHVDSIAGPGVPQVNLPGVVLPGLSDAHVHAAMFGELLRSLDLRARSKAQIIEQVRVAAAAAPAGAWIGGGGWDQSNWTPPEYPTADDLDSVSAGHPVLLDRIDGHAIWVNSSALQLAAITRATAEPDGGRIIHDASGDPGGVLVDRAADLVYAVLPKPSAAERVRRLRTALARYAAWGLTSVHDAGVGSEEVTAYHTLAAEGPLPVRVYAMMSASDKGLGDVLTRGPEVGTADGTFTLRSVKVVIDGALGSRGAELSAPYADAPAERGLALVSDAQLDSIIARAVAHRFQVNVHAIGDQATHRMLDAFERAGTAVRSLRFRDEHVSMVRDEDVARFAQLGVIASMQPVFVAEYSRFAEDRVGSARLPWVYRTRDLALAGALIAAGTDYPAADTGEPIATLYSMVTRRGPSGKPRGGWLPGQRVSVDEALRAMTVNAAYAAFEEQDRGAITVGRRADFTVLSADPYATDDEALRELRVLRTIVGGRVTYTAAPR